MSEQKLLNVREVSNWIGVPVPTLYLWVHLRKMPYVKLGRLLRFEKQAVEDLIGKGKVKSLDIISQS
ncbi:MAG: helix-turn-helix domain-containing protein [Elusimicrobia bacterium]|nr:helix-turn-helix domain-containing protein [Elusimicrobiota bacterium]